MSNYRVNFQALCGVLVDIPTLSGDKIPLNLANEVIRPSTVKRIPGYGLPHSKEPNKKGDILVTFDIQFPEKLSQNTKDLLHDLLPNKTWWKMFDRININLCCFYIGDISE